MLFSRFYSVSITATKLDYPTECAPAGSGYRDAVVTLVVPEGPALDVDVAAHAGVGLVSLGSAASCGDTLSVSCASIRSIQS